MSKQKQSDEFIENADKLKQAAEQEAQEAAAAALAAWVEAEKAREAAAWRDTTNDRPPLWRR